MEKQNKQPDNQTDYFLPKILWMIIIILLFVDVIGAAAWYRQDVQNAKLLAIALTPIHQSVKSPTTNPDTSTWKTYANSQYGFSFEYPSDYMIQEKNDNVGFYLFVTTPQTNQLITDTGGDASDALMIRPHANISILQGILPDPISFSDNYFKSKNVADWSNTYVGQVMVGNKSAYQILHAEEGWDDYTILPNEDNSIFLFDQFVLVDGNLKPTNTQIYNQILSTFKFTDSSSAVDTSTWKIYTNSLYGFQFKYPSDWPLIDTLSKNRTNSTITVGDPTGADNLANYPKCYLVINFQFTKDSILPAPYTHNYYNQIADGQNCENTIGQITSSFKFTN